MPYFDADAKASLHEPIRFKLNGREFNIESLMPETVDEIADYGKGIDETDPDAPGVGAIHRKQLSILTGEPEETFAGIDVRKTGAVIKFIVDQISPDSDKAKKKPK